MQRESDLAGELGERLVVLLGERGVAEDPTHDDDAQQLAGVRHRCDADRRVQLGIVLGQQRREPDADPRRARDPGAGDHRLLLGRDRQLRVPAVGHRDRAFQRPARARPHLGAIEVHRLLQRLRQLQQQLVEGQGAGQAAAEGADHLVGGVLLAVDAAVRVLLQALTGRHPEQCRGRRAGDRKAQHAAFAGVERPPQRGDDGEGHHADEGGEAAEGDGVHQQPVDAHRERTVRAERERDRHECGRGDGHGQKLLGPADERVEHDGAERDRGRGQRAPRRPLQAGAGRLGAGAPAPTHEAGERHASGDDREPGEADHGQVGPHRDAPHRHSGRERVDDERPLAPGAVADPAVREPEHQVHADRGQRGDRDRPHDRGHLVGRVAGGFGRREHRHRDRPAGERHERGERLAGPEHGGDERAPAPGDDHGEEHEAARPDRRGGGVGGGERGGTDAEDRAEPRRERGTRRAVPRRRLVVAQARELERGLDSGHRTGIRTSPGTRRRVRAPARSRSCRRA